MSSRFSIGLGALDLGDQQGVGAGRLQQCARQAHVVAGLAERRRRRSRRRGSAAVRMSSMSLAVRAGAERPPPCLLMPLLLDSSPPWRTTQWISRAVDVLDVHDDAAVVEQQHVAGGDVVDQFGVVEADAVAVAERAVGVEDEVLARLEQHLAAGELADADLRALQVGHDADGAAAALASRSRSGVDALAVVVGGAVGEVEPHHIDAGVDQLVQRFAGPDEAGPRVATIFVVRIRWTCLSGAIGPLRCAAPCPNAGSALGALFQDVHGRQYLAFQVFEEGAAGGGDVGHLVVDVVLLDGGDGVAAAGQA